MIGVDAVHTFGSKLGFPEAIFSRWFRTPDRIACRVPVMWVLPFPNVHQLILLFPEY